MRGTPVLFILPSLGACASEPTSPLQVERTPSGYYALRAEVTRQTCDAAAPEDPDLVLEGRIEIYPRADLGVGAYYLRFERFSWWTPNFVIVPFADDGTFASSAVSPISISRPDTAFIEGAFADGRLAFSYVDEMPAVGTPGQEGHLPACRIDWRMEATRDTAPVFESVFELIEQDCYEDMDVYAHGFLMDVGPVAGAGPEAVEFAFDSGNWWETFGPVVLTEGGFSHRQDGMNPYQPETKDFSGTFDGIRLHGTYVQEREANDDPELGSWPACRIVWKAEARLIE